MNEFGIKKFIGFGQCVALILFYFKIDVLKLDKKTAINDMIRYWSYILYLSKSDILPIANVPLKFS